MKPKISIITPSFNQAKYLETTINSIVNQKYNNLEYIIIDGGSNDGSVEIIKKYSDKLKYWVSEKDSGQGDAIRKGFSIATGDLFGWVNSDDALFPGSLDKVASVYNKCKADLIIGATAMGKENNGCISHCYFPPARWAWLPKYNFFNIGQMSTFYNRELYAAVGGIDTSLFFRMDTDLFYRMILAKPKIRVVNSVIGFMRYHADTKTNNYDNVRLQELTAFYNSSGISNAEYKFKKNIYRALCLLSLNRLFGYLLVKPYRNKRIEDIWLNGNCKNKKEEMPF